MPKKKTTTKTPVKKVAKITTMDNLTEDTPQVVEENAQVIDDIKWIKVNSSNRHLLIKND